MCDACCFVWARLLTSTRGGKRGGHDSRAQGGKNTAGAAGRIIRHVATAARIGELVEHMCVGGDSAAKAVRVMEVYRLHPPPAPPPLLETLSGMGLLHAQGLSCAAF